MLRFFFFFLVVNLAVLDLLSQHLPLITCLYCNAVLGNALRA